MDILLVIIGMKLYYIFNGKNFIKKKLNYGMRIKYIEDYHYNLGFI